jgi:hypothetical protein
LSGIIELTKPSLVRFRKYLESRIDRASTNRPARKVSGIAILAGHFRQQFLKQVSDIRWH